jgi:phosphate transport system substrate-binding protein
MPLRRAVLLSLAACALALATRGAEIRVVGSDLVASALPPALQKFARENDLTITATFAGTRPGLDRLRSGDADIGLFALPPGEQPVGDPFVSRTIGYQAVVIVVPEKLPITQLTVAQVRGIFAASGAENFSLWGELGLTGDWRTRTIAVQAVEPTAALTVALCRRALLNGADLKPLASYAPLPRVLERVRSSDNGIGLVPGLPADATGLRVVALAASVRDSALLPTPENLHDGSYPARLPLYVAFRREAAPRLLPLLRFLVGDECGDAMAQAFFSPLPLGARNQLVFELEELN